MIVLSILGHILFFCFLFIGLISLFFGLPGTWMIFVAIVLYALVTGFAEVGGGMVVLLGLLTVSGELVEHLFGFARLPETR